MHILLISLAVCWNVGVTYAQWGPYRNDLAYYDRPIWQPSRVNQDRYRSYVTPNWVNGWNSYIQNPFQFWYQPYSASRYPMDIGSRYMYQNRWNQQYPTRQYQNNWPYTNNYNVYATQPWNRLGWSQRPEYRPFREQAYQQRPIPNYYQRQQLAYPESVQPNNNWNLRNWNLNKRYNPINGYNPINVYHSINGYHPINAYHPYSIGSYQPISIKTHPYHSYPIRSHNSHPWKPETRRHSWGHTHTSNPISRNRSEHSEHNKSSVHLERQSVRHQPKVITHDRNWHFNRHYDPLLRTYRPSSHGSYPIRSHHTPDRSHHSYTIRPQRYYPLNYYLSQHANHYQHPKGVHYHNNNRNHYYNSYHYQPSNHVSNKHVVPVKKGPVDLSTLWFLNKLVRPVSPKPIHHSSKKHPGFIPFDVIVVRKVSPVKSHVNPHRIHILRPDLKINAAPLKENPSTRKPFIKDIEQVSTKPFRPLHEKVSENPQHTVFVNWGQPSNFHAYPQGNSLHLLKEASTKRSTAKAA